MTKIKVLWDRSCGAVGRVVAFCARDPLIKSQHQQDFFDRINYLPTMNCLEKTKINRREAGNAPSKRLNFMLRLRPFMNSFELHQVNRAYELKLRAVPDPRWILQLSDHRRFEAETEFAG